MSMLEGTEVPNWKYPRRFIDVVNNKSIVKNLSLQGSRVGAHVLKIRNIDNGIVFERRIINYDGEKTLFL